MAVVAVSVDADFVRFDFLLLTLCVLPLHFPACDPDERPEPLPHASSAVVSSSSFLEGKATMKMRRVP